MGDTNADKGPDLSRGVPLNAIADGKILLGHVGDEAVLLTKSGGGIFAVGATCTHYNGPLAEGIIVGDTVRCPLHHACFSLRTGEALRAPALDPVSAWRVVERDGNIHVTEKLAPIPPPELKGPDLPSSVLIIGGGAAGNAAAEMLRRKGYAGPITLLSADDSVPVDRPNLSKDYLAEQAEESWIPLRSAKFYKQHGIDLVLNACVAAIDPAAKTVRRQDGTLHSYDRLLLATGADPVHLNIPGAERVHYLRTLDDSRAIIAAAEKAKRAVIIGASFIGLEAAAALRERGLEVHVVGPEPRPLEKILGPEIGDFIRALHESHGVIFHLGTSATAISDAGVTLTNGASLPADLIVAGIGVRPAIALAQDAGLKIDLGIAVNEYLETSVPGIFAAGDLARWPDPLSGQNIRVEHWVVAEQQGQVAAHNILGRRQRYEFVPFFWSQHYDVSIRYVGHAEHWDRTTIDGDLAAKSCQASYFSNGRKLAVATIGRDRDALVAEAGFEALIAET
ncbi:MAG: FAD-dependent oxidoreductase [Methylovirgula sp.]